MGGDSFGGGRLGKGMSRVACALGQWRVQIPKMFPTWDN